MNEKIEKLEAKRAKIVAEIQRVKAREATEARKADTRRKIIVGSIILGMAQKGEGVWKSELGVALNKYLSREQDRSLFNLPPIPPSTP